MEDPIALLKLKDFIRSSLVEIVQGVDEAREATGGDHSGIGKVAHLTIEEDDPNTKTTKQTYLHEAPDLVQKIEFDIAVTVAANKSVKAQAEGGVGGDIYVLQAKTNFQGGTERGDTQTHASRIKFSVPVIFEGGSIGLVRKVQWIQRS